MCLVTDLFKQSQLSCLRQALCCFCFPGMTLHSCMEGTGQRCRGSLGKEPSTRHHWSCGLAFPQEYSFPLSTPVKSCQCLPRGTGCSLGKLLPSLCCISQFKQVQLGDKMDLASYLLKPIQRMSKYALLLKDLIKECSEAQEQELGFLRAAEEMVKFQLRHGNDLLAMDAIRDCDVRSSAFPCPGEQSHTYSSSLDLGSLDCTLSLPSGSPSDQSAVCQHSRAGMGKGAVGPGGLLDFLGQTAWVLLP